MGKVASTLGMVAGVVALSIALPGVGTALGISAATAGTIASVASAASAVLSAVGQATMKPPKMQGTVSQVMIGANMPVPYAMGRTYLGGNKVYDKSANGPDNFDRTQIFVGTAAGPIEEFQALQADYTTISFSGADWNVSRVATGFYGADGGYLWLNTRKGLRPETALTAFPGRDAFSEWGSDYKLSGFAAWALTMEFDEDGKRWASGVPQWGMIAKWVKIYDPRLDSTYPGGSGAHRWDDESTWAWSENPALHALAYARGRFVSGVKVIGVGLSEEAIDVAAYVELANVCDANGWTIGGAVYEGPDLSKWDNLKRILMACAAEPVWVGGVLTVKYSAPMVALDTITADDLADGEVEVRAMKGWRDRKNTIIPRYRSEAHKWEYVQAEAVTSSTYVTEDGEEKTDEVQFDLVQNVTQAAELAAYRLVNMREFGPIKLTVKPRLILYRPGEALELDIEEAGLANQLAVITSRSVDPSSGAITLMLESETTAKHAFALGQTGVAPPTPVIVPTEDVDDAVSELSFTTAEITQLISTSYVTDADPPDGLLQATATQITVESHSRTYSDKAVSVTGGTLTTEDDGTTALVAETTYHVYYDDPQRAGGAVSLKATQVSATAATSSTNPFRHYVGTIPTDATGGTGTSGGGVTPPGWSGNDFTQTP